MTGGVIKFSVLHGKRAAVIEMPSSATVGALAAELATRFKLDHPTAIKFKLPDSDASLRVQDYPDATLESSGGCLWPPPFFCHLFMCRLFCRRLS